MGNRRRKVFVIVAIVMVLAFAVFMVVGDLFEKNNKMTEVRAATSGSVTGTGRNKNNKDSMSLEYGVYLVIFSGQDGESHWDGRFGRGATCVGFYEGSSLSYNIGSTEELYRAGTDEVYDGGGGTRVFVNFGCPTTDGSGNAWAAGGGAGGGAKGSHHGWNQHCADATFKGYYNSSTGWSDAKKK